MYIKSISGNTLDVQNNFRENPLDVTKAVEFTDVEINSMWVDWPNEGGFAEFFNVNSSMPRIFRGGKGVGRTHIMRHFSAPVQAIRDRDNPMRQVENDGVLGVYVICSGLNSYRFRGRGRDLNTWQTVFANYTDLWLAQAALDAFLTVSTADPPTAKGQRDIIHDIMTLLNHSVIDFEPSIKNIRDYLYAIQRQIDTAVNNAAINPLVTFDFVIPTTPGELVFGIPHILRKHYAPLRDTIFLYLIDEFENFECAQQQYINTLIRENKQGTSFMLGVRTYGLKTFMTLSGGEENKHGSEFVEYRPELDYFRRERRTFAEFCANMVVRRLAEHGMMDDSGSLNFGKRLEDFFEIPTSEHEEKLFMHRYEGRERPYFNRLNNYLSLYGIAGNGDQLSSEEIEFIIDAIRVPSRPLLEKINTFLLYRDWSKKKSLVNVAERIKQNHQSPDSTGFVHANEDQKRILNHFVTDMKAQLTNEMRGSHVYAGFSEFVIMADGLPRNLLVILKNIYKWAIFNGEQPFAGGKISLDSQRLGVREAAEWFFADAKPLGPDGDAVLAAIERLATMFRRFRFADKPVESSLASFSADLTSCKPRVREMVKSAEQMALLIRARKSQKNRSTGLQEPKFHLNRLLSPLWDLPTARRGAIRLNAEEMNAIFDPQTETEFTRIVVRRLSRMQVPFGRVETKRDDPKLL